MHRFGHVALAGVPNAGKSTLLNRLVGADLAIVSPKAQTTRLPVTGLRTDEHAQIVLHDLPGLLQPEYPLQTRMLHAAQETLARVHLVLHLHPAPDRPAAAFWPLAGLPPREVPVVTVYTKADRVSAAIRRDLAESGAAVVSAHTGTGIPALVARMQAAVPAGESRFPPDDVGTQPLRFFAAEYLREAAFHHLSEEVPYAVAAEVEEFRDATTPVYIRVSLFVERDSQKGIVIGRGGRTLQAIGRHARVRLEALLGSQVFLECRVKVLRNWRRDPAQLSRLGFPEPGGSRRRGSPLAAPTVE